MAQVSFTIGAIDRTRGAFASVRQGLREVNQQAKTLNGGLLGMGLKFAGLGTAIGLVAGRARYLNENFNAMNGIPEDAIGSVDVLASQMSGLTDVIDAVILGWSKGIPDAVQLAIYWFDRLTKGEDEAARLMVEREQAAVAAMRAKPEYLKREKEALDALTKSQKELAQVSESDGASIARRRAEAAALQQMANGIGDPIKRAEKQTESVKLQTDAERDYNKLAKESKQLTTDLAVANSKLLGSTLPLSERIEGLNAAYARLSAQLYDFSEVSDPKVLEKRNELLREQTEIANQLTKAYEEQERTSREAANVITGGFEDAVFAGAGLRDMIKGIGQDLMRYIFQQTITRSLGNFLTGGITSLFSGGGPTLDMGGLSGARAAGGPVTGGRSYLVGENGPEIFQASQSGRIVANGSTGGGGNTYIIDARGTDESVVNRLAATMMQLAGPGVVERRAVAATADSRMRMAMA